MRGDVPKTIQAAFIGAKFSPRARGCSEFLKRPMQMEHVFPACAGMFLIPDRDSPHSASFPRVRGDVPRVLKWWSKAN